ncbi:MAG: putative restriction endonuclease [Solirubrobacteraceae bacterium]|nr:putative restriction endonuclease [Solirubrobacteraceae bacterium]
MELERDYEMRLVAIDRVRSLSDRYDDIVPLDVLRKGFAFAGERISFGSFYSGIFRARQMRGPAALSLTTTPPKTTRGAPYDDGLDEATNSFAIHHLAYDRNLMGIDPGGHVHVAERLLREQDGPMLKAGLQGFHGAAIFQPKRPAERPDPARLEVRYETFRTAA